MEWASSTPLILWSLEMKINKRNELHADVMSDNNQITTKPLVNSCRSIVSIILLLSRAQKLDHTRHTYILYIHHNT